MSEGTQRKLAAIMAADVVGYSRLMGEDEAGTLAALRQLRSGLFAPTVRSHGGAVVKNMGDGWLVAFDSAADAITCAIAVQAALADHDTIKLRAAIHVGDVTHADEDVFGDGVNVASRLQDLAEPGAIVISETARRSIDAKLSSQFTDLGAQHLKNIAEPIDAFGWGMVSPSTQPPAIEMTEKPSIAVLAFYNMSEDAEQTFFADGMAEDIISALSRFHWFFVISRNSSFTYKGRAVDVKQVAHELGVRYVLEGSVRKAGNRVRVTAQLIDALADRHVWAERFDGVLEDIFELQDEITRKIVSAVAPEYLSTEMQRARRKDIPRLDAWELAVRAHWHISQFTKADVAKARTLLKTAVELDQQSSFGLADLSFTYQVECVNGWSDDPEASIAEAVKLAQRAVSINSRDAYAFALLGAADLYSGRHGDAVRQLEHAISLNANDPHAYALLGRAMIYLGNGEEGLAHVEQAIRLSPRDPIIALWYTIRSLCDFVEGRHESAAEWAEASIRAQPNRSVSYMDLAVNYALSGRREDAQQAIVDLTRLVPNASIDLADRTHPFVRTEDRERYHNGLRAAGLT
jgi:adenylate cyclase